MIRFCSQCGARLDTGVKFCARCGAPIKAPVSAPTPSAAPTPPVTPARPEPPRSAPAPQKKKKKKSGLKALIVLFVIAALIAFLVFAVGNYITLKIHTDKVLDSLNSGNLDLSSFQSDPYEGLPLYVVEMMGEDTEPSQIGPVVSAMAPYLSFERTEIHGFFGNSQVEYRIVSRDLSQWLLTLDYAAVTSPEQLQQMILEYIPEAPRKEYYVTVTYYKDGLFGWKGNYEIPEFADAISGGLNTAFNTLYEKMIEELEGVLG